MSFDPRRSVAGVLADLPSTSQPFKGTAFLIQGGVVVTCSHVLKEARRNETGHVEVLFYGQQKTTLAEILLDNPERDLAVLRPLTLPEGVVPLSVAPSASAENREFESLGYRQTSNFPVQAAQGKTYRVIHNTKGHAFLQLSSFEVAPGFSGGPVLDLTSHIVVGIVSSGVPEEPEPDKRGRSFAIVTETLQFLYPDLELTSLPPANTAGWLRPTAPPLHNMIRREVELHKVEKLLQPGVITTIQGPPCVGKTVLVHQLALDLDPLFPGGVIFQSLGSEFRSSDLCNPILKEWSLFDAAERGRDSNAPVTPAEVRALFARQQPLLVILDDIWNLDAVQPLRDALPQNACLLVTTRSQRIAHDLHGNVYPLDVLLREDALELLFSRLPDTDKSTASLLIDLIEGLGRQALAINIACGSLLRLRQSRWPAAIQEMLRQVTEGTGFGEIQLPDEYPDPRVSSALFTSYQDLKPESQRRFRLLGAFAPDAPFSAQAAAGIWSCSPEEAEDQFTLFVERSLLTQHTDRLWRQHTLLRAYCLALVRQAGEEESARHSHAQTYNQLIQAADDRQEPYRLLDEYLQLKHAFEWAIKHDLRLAQDLASNAANLQQAFSLVQDQYIWASRLITASQKTNDESVLALAQATIGNALSQLADLPGESRSIRLLEALEAYSNALKIRRPDIAPLAYATTQNNRGVALSNLAASPDEDRRARLLEALEAYSEALKFRHPDTAPLDYAMTQNNRGTVLSDLAALSGKNRHTRLLEVLESYAQALHYARPEVVPIDYAMTQNNRGNVFRELATVPGEDHRTRLLEALEAYSEALKFRRPDTAPLDYAMTQNNRGTVLSDLAVLPGEDCRTRLLEALEAYSEALNFRRPDIAPLAYALTQNNRGTALRDLATLSDEDQFLARLLEALDAYSEALKFQSPETTPLDYARTLANMALLLMDISLVLEVNQREYVRNAITSAVTAYSISNKVGHQPVINWVQEILTWISEQIGASLFLELWQELNLGETPDWLKDSE